MPDDLSITPTLTIPGRHLSWSAVRASGPGGQNVNKVASKIDYRFDLEGCTVLSDAVKARLRHAARHRLDADGRVVIVSQSTRDQSRNVRDARDRLAALIAGALQPPRKRRPTKPSRASKRRRVDAK